MPWPEGTGPRARVLFAALALAACAPPALAPTAPAVPVTRIASLDTATPSPIPPSPTRTPEPTPTPSPTPTSSPTATTLPVVRLMAVGDVMLSRSIGERLAVEGPALPFAAVAPTLAGADLTVANLECTISELGAPGPKAYTFRAPLLAAEALSLAGVDVVGLANNHALDFGYAALEAQSRLLEELGILGVGVGEDARAARAPLVVERNGLRVGFLSYVDVPVETSTGFDTRRWIATESGPGLAWGLPTDVASDVSQARAAADVIVVLMHFGLEGRTQITSAQRALARAAIDAGAALVLGSHPHVLQRTEAYGGGLIAYSLGNFVFDGFTLPENYSAIFSATLTEAGVGEYNWIPVVIENGLPRLATAEEAPAILNLVRPVE